MKKYIVLLLMLVSVRALLADAMASQAEPIQLSSGIREVAPSMRVITEEEFEGADPITIKLNQSLIIPCHYQRNILSNEISVFFGPDDRSMLNVNPDGVTWSNNGGVLDVNLICTGIKLGQTTVRFGEAGKTIKEFTIQVVE